MKSQRKLNRALKWTLRAGAVIFVLCLIGLGVSLSWWQANGATFGMQAEAAQKDGATAAVISDQRSCFQQTAELYNQLSGVASIGIANSFLGTCLPAARVTPGFCEVPEGVTSLRRWRTERCEEVPENLKAACETLVGSLQQTCARVSAARRTR